MGEEDNLMDIIFKMEDFKFHDDIKTDSDILENLFHFLVKAACVLQHIFPRQCPFWYIAPGIWVDVEKTDSLFL